MYTYTRKGFTEFLGKIKEKKPTSKHIFTKHMKYQNEEKIYTDWKSTRRSCPDDHGAMPIGLKEGKVCDPRILYLARLSYIYSDHDKQKAFSSVQGLWKYSNHVSFMREIFENVFQSTMKWIKNESLREVMVWTHW